jgi:hypothetical protein
LREIPGERSETRDLVAKTWMAGSSPAMTRDETCKRDARMQAKHEKVWGFGGLPLESP